MLRGVWLKRGCGSPLSPRLDTFFLPCLHFMWELGDRYRVTGAHTSISLPVCLSLSHTQADINTKSSGWVLTHRSVTTWGQCTSVAKWQTFQCMKWVTNLYVRTSVLPVHWSIYTCCTPACASSVRDSTAARFWIWTATNSWVGFSCLGTFSSNNLFIVIWWDRKQSHPCRPFFSFFFFWTELGCQ